jgi:signal transduction histidine kinase
MTSPAPVFLTQRERELGAIINAYNEVAERLKAAHERLSGEVMRLREQLEEKNRELARRERLAALGHMAAGVAHEIRNPLAGIQLYAVLLAKDLADSELHHGYARKIVNGVTSLEAIVSDVLDFAGEHAPHMVECPADAMVEEVCALAEPLRTERSITMHRGGALHDCTLRGDSRQVQQALLNLVRNAIEAAPQNGNVWIDAEADDETVAMSVADDGPGVPADVRERIFNPFFTTRDAGTGLGLAIVHRIAEAHGGAVRVENRPSGGACFVLTFPKWRPDTTKFGN